MWNAWRKHLNGLIVAAILLAIACGSLLNYAGVAYERTADGAPTWGYYLFELMDLAGKAFLKAMKMVIIPVIVFSIAFGLGGMSGRANMGRIAGRTIAYYVVTTALAVLAGLAIVIVLAPGSAPELADTVRKMTEAPASKTVEAKIARARSQLANEGLEGLQGFPLLFKKLKNLALSLFPDNAVDAMARGRFLPVIVFSIFLGLSLLAVRDRTPLLVPLFEQAQELFFAMLHGILLVAPIGFFALVASLCWTVGLQGMSSVGRFAMAVVLGLVFHAVVILPAICWVVGRTNPWTLACQLRAPLVMAFSTASSSATLPLTLKTMEQDVGIGRDHASFVLPLGATVNMDGTALYESVALITLATAYAAANSIGLDWGLVDYAVICITVTLAAVGAAGVPGAGIFMLIMLMSTIQVGDQTGIPPQLIGLIIVIDRPLDMLRTCVNVWGDAVGTVVVASMDTRQS